MLPFPHRQGPFNNKGLDACLREHDGFVEAPYGRHGGKMAVRPDAQRDLTRGVG